jgi:hypothetical protein
LIDRKSGAADRAKLLGATGQHLGGTPAPTE